MASHTQQECETHVKVLTEEEIEGYREAFHIFDKDNDGSITTKEVKALMNSLGLKSSDAKIKAMIEEKDADGNGTLDFEEFLKMMTGERKDHEDELGDFRDAFRVFDRDGNGLITQEELKYTLDHLGNNVTTAEVAQMIKDADQDGDGQIDFEEFVHMMKSKK